DADYGSLRDLADYLLLHPDRTVALVGHTDSAGSLATNIALSKRRAGSVLERLVTVYGVARRQLEAEGMGYLAPVSSNLTEAGREANRRVEVIITSTQE
ncbi:MAG: OmpA family protein, partial [Paracoccaceae bacterium]|nr:OmpA family protein [Paracoccaceae bacterium]